MLEVGRDLAETGLVELDEVHLVDREHDVRDAEGGRDVRVPARLLDHALARVEEHDRDVGGGRAGDHVARVLDVTGGVGELKAATRGHERAVRDVDRDALLALRAQAVGQQRKVHVAVTTTLARLLDVLELVGHHLLGVVQQSAEERGLAVVDRAARDEAEELTGTFACGENARSSRHASCPPWLPPRSGRRPGSRRAR